MEEPAAGATLRGLNLEVLWQLTGAAVVAGPDHAAGQLVEALAAAGGDLDFQHKEHFDYHRNEAKTVTQSLECTTGEDTNRDALLHSAAQHGRPRCVATLLHHGASTTVWTGTVYLTIDWRVEKERTATRSDHGAGSYYY